jgi:hypothetical protein
MTDLAPSTQNFGDYSNGGNGFDTQNSRPDLLPLPTPIPRGTYRYDGGPQNPIPMPKADPAPAGKPPLAVPPDGKVVSLKPKPTKFTYPAYGETPQWRTPLDAPAIRVVQSRGR